MATVSYEAYKRLRDARGITDAFVSRSTKIAPMCFSDWRHGRTQPKADKLYTIARFFGVPMERFMEEG